MSTRTLDWYDLVLVAQRRNSIDRVITVGGIPAHVKSHLSVDAGFYVHSLEDAGDEKWSLRTREEMRLLRLLAEQGLVTIDDNVDRWRLREWETLLADATRGCYVAGCTSTDIDERGPVFDDRKRMHKACPGHWEGVYAVLGAQQAANNPETYEIVRFGSDEPVRTGCVVCGAAPETAHDQLLHTAAAAHQSRET